VTTWQKNRQRSADN